MSICHQPVSLTSLAHHLRLRCDIIFAGPIQSAPIPGQPRARGQVRLSANLRGLQDLRQAGSLKCLFPKLPRAGLEAVLINTAGGITGGDHFDVAAHAQTGADLTLTTQACERAYRAQPGQTGRLETRLTVDDDARLSWLPQETLLFDGCDLERRLRVDLALKARALIVEPVIFGRLAMDERMTSGSFRDRIDIRRAGTPLYLDCVRLDQNMTNHLARPFIGCGAAAIASAIYVAPDAEAHLDNIRQMLPPSGGVSLVQPDVLVLRLLAADGFELRQTLIPVLSRLRAAPLPRTWMI